ncbi:NAD-dependent epimerase/dehydratase family protein [Mucilaginibacter sp. McL0603]|uniref:NAD-dependent epimerase/dehydratase family protein n=1 Tax=Mucilaginibacter sp. McL0603 TaxID=3415670 RepID=UPI003CF88C7D
MTIGITGASGFLGTNLKSYLSKDNCMVIEEIPRQALRPDSAIELVELASIVHMAGKAHDLKNVSDPAEYYQVNFELTKRLYDAFLLSSARKFIFISSVKAVADHPDGILTEKHHPVPETPYGKSKLLAEEYIQKQRLPAGKSYFILRPCMIHGRGNKGNLNLLFKFVRKRIPYPLAGFDNKRSFLSVENLCFVIKELITREDIESGVYNVADDATLSTNQVISIISSTLNIKTPQWKIDPKIIAFLAKIGDRLQLPLTTERLSKLTEDYQVSNQKIKQAIKKELPLTAAQGIAITIRSFDNS